MDEYDMKESAERTADYVDDLNERITALEADLTTLREENEKLRGALEHVEKLYLKAFRSSTPDEDWFKYLQPIVDVIKPALAAHKD